MNLALLGLLSLVQVVFLPGYLLLRALRIGGGGIATFVFSFGLSLIANYFLVVILAALGIYRPAVVYMVFAAELIVWLRIDGRHLQTGLGAAVRAAGERASSWFCELERASGIRLQWLRRTLIVAALAVIGLFALAGVAEAGRIFEQWDAVVSWNRWAIDWAGNHLPQVTSYYPQLLPANMSLTYVFMQTSEVWIFAKAMQFLFCLMLMLAMLDAARQPGNFGLVPGIVVTYVLLVALLRYRMLSSGYAELPLAFFAWMPVYALMLASRAADGNERSRYVLLGALLAAGAALTKQMGLYVAVAYPLLAWLGAGSREQGAGSMRLLLPAPRSLLPARRTLVMLYLLQGLLVAPWYVYKCADIQAGHDANNTPQLVSDFHQGRSVPARIIHGGTAIVAATTLPGAVLLSLALAASLRDARSRWLLGLFVAPLGSLWAVAFSYDLRNLAMLVPFVGMSAGIGLVRFICWAEKTAQGAGSTEGSGVESRELRGEQTLDSQPSTLPAPCSPLPARCVRLGHAVGFLTIGLLTASLCISDKTLLSIQRCQQRCVGIRALNSRLYAYFEKQGVAPCSPLPARSSLIATDYLALRWLPDLAPRSVVCTCHKLTAFRQTFDRPDVRYILVQSGSAAAEVRTFLGRSAAVRLLFEDHGFSFYEKQGGQSQGPVQEQLVVFRP